MSIIDKDEVHAPPILYKYRCWDNKNHKTILTNREVYLAPPSIFEDEKDCRINRKYNLSDQEVYNQYLRHSLRYNVGYTLEEHRNYATEWTQKAPFKDNLFIEQFKEEEFNKLDSKVGVLSLTPFNNSLTMWNYYGNDASGFCVGLDTKTLFNLVGGGGEVCYFDQLPSITLGEDFNIQIWKQFYCKEQKWEFEKEYRVRIFKLNGLNKAERIKRVPKECIKEVLFGWNIKEIDRTKIVNVCKSSGLRPNLFQADFVDGIVVIRPL